jgi:hypothetical protein
MRARHFIVEYNQAKTAQVFGPKLITALANDKGSHFGTLSGSREYLRQKDKIGAKPDEQSYNYTVKAILQDLENADPTTNKEYTQWLAKCYANEAQKIEDLTSKGTDWLKKYHQFKVKRLLPDNLRNIANLKFSQLYDIIANDELNAKLDAIENAPSKDKGQSETVYDDADVRIIVPLDEPAACYYGQGTQWCTAAKNNNRFNQYNRNGRMYIMLPKNPKYDGEKYQLHFQSEQFMDETDNDVGDLYELLSGRFNPAVLTFFRQNEPVMSTWVAYASDETLQPLINKIAELMTDKIWDVISDWETQDGYYYEWLQENGYVDEETMDVDWDKMSADNVDYLRYNDEAKEWSSNMEDALRPSPEECRDIALNRDAEYGGHLEITDFERCISINVNNNVEDGTSDMANTIDKDIFVRKDAKGYYVQRRSHDGTIPKERSVRDI